MKKTGGQKSRDTLPLNHPGAIHPNLLIVLVQNGYRSMQGIEYILSPHTAASTFAFSSVFILLL